jgi:hypothetical protein
MRTQAILKFKDPGGDFAKLVAEAKGGTLFIDEAYRLTPAPAGKSPNASNEVLDCLLEVPTPHSGCCFAACCDGTDVCAQAVEDVETRETTTFILAGYRDEIEILLGTNVGFASRFSTVFDFPDYTEQQCCRILLKMIKVLSLILKFLGRKMAI